jgi:hypothetical protein
MNKDIEDDIIDQLRALYSEDDVAERFFDWAAGRKNDATQTSVDRLSLMAQASRPETIRLARKLDEFGCGQFVQGRKGRRSRMIWSYSLKSMGLAAQGERDDLEEIDLELAQDAEDQQEIASTSVINEAVEDGRFTIAEAKRRLAETLGIEPEAIEITIRA